jgi:flagellar hook assembly protein FlgD
LDWEVGNLASYVGIGDAGSNPVTPLITVYPNPFKNELNIKFQNPKPKIKTSIKIYDATGRLVKQWDYQTIKLSNHLIWSGDDEAGSKVPAGVYFVRFESEDYKQTNKAILLR